MSTLNTTPRPERSFLCSHLRVRQYQTADDVGEAAAHTVASRLQLVLRAQDTANLLLATGASQIGFLTAIQNAGLDWSRITIFHLDEYTDLSPEHPASFRHYLHERIVDAVRPAAFHPIEADATDLPAVIEEYEALLRQNPIDIACIGIGENGHIAFNDPPVADFDDPRWVKEVELDELCRLQQVNEGWFPSLEETPRRAVTVTIPAIMSSRFISCVVPGERKADAVREALRGPITTACPASILRQHPDATLFLDRASGVGV